MNTFESEVANEHAYNNSSYDAIFKNNVLPLVEDRLLKTSDYQISKSCLKFIVFNKRLAVSSYLGLIAAKVISRRKFEGFCAVNPQSDGTYITKENFSDYVEPEVAKLFSEQVALGVVLVDLNKNQVITPVNLDEDEMNSINTFYKPLPMLIKPKKVKRAEDTGYIVKDVPFSILCDSARDNLESFNNKYFNINFAIDVLNYINSIPYSLNQEIGNNFHYKQKKPITTEYQLKNYQRFCACNKHLTDYYISEGNKLYFLWAYDTRGRFYDNGYHLKVQGTSFQKAQLEFNRKEVIED